MYMNVTFYDKNMVKIRPPEVSVNPFKRACYGLNPVTSRILNYEWRGEVSNFYLASVPPLPHTFKWNGPYINTLLHEDKFNDA